MTKRLALTAALVGVAIAGCSSPEVPQQRLPDGSFGAALNTIAGHADSSVEQIPCTARAFGVSPPGVTRVAEVTSIYAWSFCRGRWERDGPVSMSFVQIAVTTGDHPKADEIPDDTGPGDARFNAMFPPDVRTWAGKHPSIAWVTHP